MLIKSIDFPNREFPSKSELFAALKSQNDVIFALKKSDLKPSEGQPLPLLTKELASCKSMQMEEGYIYPVINTTKWMDSHNDVHIDGIWDRSVKDQQGKVYYLVDHDMKIASVIAFPQDVKMSVQQFTFRELGYVIDGNTQALVFQVPKNKVKHDMARQVVEEKIPIEHSVRMQYVALHMCIDSEEEGYKEYKANWDMYYPYIANKDRADEEGYFWAVTEAKIYKEGSMVLAGSNSITPLLQKDNEPPAGTQDKGTAASTPQAQRNKLLI